MLVNVECQMIVLHLVHIDELQLFRGNPKCNEILEGLIPVFQATSIARKCNLEVLYVS